MNRDTKKAAQDSYHEARSHGHTKEEARKIRDNWKPSKTSYQDDDEDEDEWVTTYSAYDEETELNRKYYESLDPSHPDYRDLD